MKLFSGRDLCFCAPGRLGLGGAEICGEERTDGARRAYAKKPCGRKALPHGLDFWHFYFAGRFASTMETRCLPVFAQNSAAGRRRESSRTKLKKLSHS